MVFSFVYPYLLFNCKSRTIVRDFYSIISFPLNYPLPVDSFVRKKKDGFEANSSGNVQVDLSKPTNKEHSFSTVIIINYALQYRKGGRSPFRTSFAIPMSVHVYS
jgi:hypothetical protein